MHSLPATLLNELEDDIVGLQKITIINIFDNCFDQKGNIDDNLIIEYQRKVGEAINMAEGLKKSIDRQEDCQSFFNVA
eukprot:228610-Ditylum_brightwellii.AAC.1